MKFIPDFLAGTLSKIDLYSCPVPSKTTDEKEKAAIRNFRRKEYIGKDELGYPSLLITSSNSFSLTTPTPPISPTSWPNWYSANWVFSLDLAML